MESHFVTPIFPASNKQKTAANWTMRRKQRLPPRFHSAPVRSFRETKPRNNSMDNSMHDHLANDMVIAVPIRMSADEYNIQQSTSKQLFCSTTRVKKVALPAISSDNDSLPWIPSRPVSRAVTMCGERYMFAPVERSYSSASTHTHSTVRSNVNQSIPVVSEQQQRFQKERMALAECRLRKRTTEVMSHRMNRSYYMTGRKLSPANKFSFDTEKLWQLQQKAQNAGLTISSANTGTPRASPHFTRQEAQDEEDLQNGLSENVFITQSTRSEAAKQEDSVMPDDSVSNIGECIPDEIAEEDEVVEEDVGAEAEAEDAGVVYDGADSANGEEEVVDKAEIDEEDAESSIRENDITKIFAAEENFLSDVEEEEAVDDDDDAAEADLNLLQFGEVKLACDRHFFKGWKFSAKQCSEDEQFRNGFREVTQQLVIDDDVQIQSKLDSDQLDNFTKLFEEMDAENQGRVSLVDLHSKLVTEDTKNLKLKQWIRVFDVSGKRSIDLRELLAVAAINDGLLNQRTLNPSVEWNIDFDLMSYYITAYSELFRQFDGSKTGRISSNDLTLVVAAGLNLETSTDAEMMNQIMSSIDVDDDGLHFVDFLTYIPLFVRMHKIFLQRPMLVEDVERMRRRIKLHCDNANRAI